MDDVDTSVENINKTLDELKDQEELSPDELEEFGKTHGFVPKDKVDSFLTGAQEIIDNAMKDATPPSVPTKDNVLGKMQDYMRPVNEVDDLRVSDEAKELRERKPMDEATMKQKLTEAIFPTEEVEEDE